MRLNGFSPAVAPVIAALLALGAVPATASVPVAAAPASADRATKSVRGELLSVTGVVDLDREQVAAALAAVPFDGARARYGVRGYRIEYRTVGVRGEPTTASALVALPVHGPARARTVVWEHGTRVGRADVASVSGDNLDRPAAVLFATAGFVTVAPDYLGLGTGPGAHPYAHVASEVTASVDALRAGRELARRRGLRLGDDVLVSGFSQGGPAAMALGEQVAGMPGLRLRALAPISGVYDLAGTELPGLLDGRVNPLIGTFYLAYWTVASNPIYRLYGSAAEVFAPPYDQSLPVLFDGDHDESQIIAALPASPQDLMTERYTAWVRHPDGALARAIDENSATCQWRPRVPVRLYATAADQEVPFGNTQRCAAQLRVHGAGPQVVQLGDLEHLQTPVVALPQVVDWFERPVGG